MFGWAEICKECRHLVEGAAPHRLVVPKTELKSRYRITLVNFFNISTVEAKRNMSRQICPVAAREPLGGAPAAGEVVSDLLLVDPQEAVQREHVRVADERQAVVARVKSLAVGRNLREKPANTTQLRSGCVLHTMFRFCTNATQAQSFLLLSRPPTRWKWFSFCLAKR